MISVIVSGAGGQLGRAFIDALPFTEDFSVFTFDRHQLDIADQEKISHILETLPQVKYWINCAAYTRVDDAEIYEREARLSNVIAPGFIAAACREKNVHLFHFSSDYVYHNGLRRPLLETDPTEPKSVYAISKLDGERVIAETGVSHTIIRTSWVYGPGGHNFVNTMLRLGKTQEFVNVVSDQLGAPTYTHEIAKAVKKMIHLHEDNQVDIRGIFNFANAGEVNWADFARTIFLHAGYTCKVNDITTEEYAAPAARPEYSVLDCGRIMKLLHYEIPSWDEALKSYLFF